MATPGVCWMRIWRSASLGLAVVVVASACGGTEDSPSTTPAGAPGTTASPSSAPGGSSEGLDDALAGAGIQVIDEPGTFAAGGPLELWSFQVENLGREIDAGGGYLGAQLDELAGSPGGLPFSYLVAGWLSAAPTPTAEAAAALMGDQPWQEAPSLVYPTAVLALFVADAVETGGGAGGEAAAAVLAALAQEGLCSTLSGWVSSVLDYIFDSLKVNTEDEGFLGWLGTVWNAAVDLARDTIGGLIEAVTAPIVAAIADALAIVGTLSMIVSLLKPWSLEVTASHAQTRFAVGGEPDIAEDFVAMVDTGIDFEWPAAVEDCAALAGLTLPDPASAEGSQVEWKTSGLPPLGSAGESQTTIDQDNQASFEWVTGREDSDEGDVLTGVVGVSVTVRSQQVEELKAMLESLIAGQIPVAPFGDVVAELFSALTAPIFEALAELTQVSGADSVLVIHHDEPEEEPDVPATSASTVDACVVGTWVSADWTLPGPAGLDGTGGSGALVTIGSDGSARWDFDGMAPIVAVDSQIDVTTEMSTSGGATGTVTAISGTWTVDADTSGLSGRAVDNIIGEFPLAGGPGLFVAMSDGSYTCSGDTLTVTTRDPVEQRDIPVSLDRR
jgi:hypothetical protein